jgi:hypothetical protein
VGRFFLTRLHIPKLVFDVKGAFPPLVTALCNRPNLIFRKFKQLFDLMMLRFPFLPPTHQHPEYLMLGRLEIIEHHSHFGCSYACLKKDAHSGTKIIQFSNANFAHNPNVLTAQARPQPHETAE